MTRQQLELHQVWAYLAAILAGLVLGSTVPDLAPTLETVLWPALGLLLYATFTQVPLAHLPEAFRDRRFMGAVLVGNFVAAPLLVWGLGSRRRPLALPGLLLRRLSRLGLGRRIRSRGHVQPAHRPRLGRRAPQPLCRRHPEPPHPPRLAHR